MAKVKVVKTNLNENLSGNYFNDTPSNTIFSFGKFFVTTNFDGKTTIDYTNSLSSFVRPVTLETMGVSEVQSEIIQSYTTNAVLNLDKSDLNTFVRYGSAYEFLRVSIQNIILSYPGSLFLNSQKPDTTIYHTYSGYSYDVITNISTIYVPVGNTINTFGLVYNKDNESLPDDNELKNLNISYDKYVIWSSLEPNKLFKIVGYTGNTANHSDYLTRNYLKLQVEGDPFALMGTGNTGNIDYHIRPSNVVFEEFRALLNTYEKNIVSERDGKNGFIFTLKDPTMLEDGKIIYSDSRLIWTTADGYNIDINTPTYQRFLQIVLTIGAKYDKIKTDLIARFLTPTSLKMYDFTEEGKMSKLLRIYGREFDQIRQFIDSLVNINKITYDKLNNIPDQLIKNMARTFGWDYFSLVNEEELVESFLTVDDTERNLNDQILPAEIDIELWRRIINNTSYFWKSKGTRQAIKSMFLLIGIPEPFINITEYVYTVDGKINPNTVPLTQADFPSNSLPYDTSGYPVAPLETNDFYFQLSGNSDSGQAYLDVFRIAGFNLKQTPDNKKSWIQTGATTRVHYSTPQYYQEDSRLVINTKEVDVALDTARGIEYDVYDYILKDFAANSSGYTLPYSYVNISLPFAGQKNTFDLPTSINYKLGDFEVRYNGILLNAPSTGDSASYTSGNTEITPPADYSVSGNSFTILNGNYAYNNSNRRDVIQVTLIDSGATTAGYATSAITINYIVTRIKANMNGTVVPLPSFPRGDVQLTINGIALTKGTPQFTADYILDPANSTGSSQIIIQNPDVISFLNANPDVQISYMEVQGSNDINLRSEVIRVDSFNTGKIYFNNSANKYVYKLNYKVNNASEVKFLVDGIALEPLTDYNINVQNPYEIFLPKGIRYGSVISAYYLVGGSGAFSPVVNDSFGLGDISQLSFLEFLELVQRKMINARNRKTVTDFKGGWYPTLLRIYETYLERALLPDDNPLQSNGYTFLNLYPFLSKYNAFFQRFVDQLLSATIILRRGGLLIRNSVFTKQKHWYKRGINVASGTTGYDMRGNTLVQYFGDAGSEFQIIQDITPPPPPPTPLYVETTPAVLGSIITGGRNIIGFNELIEYGIEYKEISMSDWNKISQTDPLAVNNFGITITGVNEDSDYQYRAYIKSLSTGATGNTLTITTPPPPPPTPFVETTSGIGEVYLDGSTYKGRIANTGGMDIIGFADVQYYRMQYRTGTTGTWLTTTQKFGPLAVNNWTETISDLETNTTYQYRALMIVNGVTYNGTTRTRTIPDIPTTIPSLTTGIAGNLTTNSFSIANSIVDSKGNLPTVSKYGVIWTQSSGVGSGLNYSNKSGVDETNSDIAIGTPFTKNATGLLANTQTWYRAFAENTNGYGYGDVRTAQTQASVAEIQFASIIGGNQAVMGGNNLAGKTFSITFSYHIVAACDLIGVSGQNNATTNIHVSTNGGVTWVDVDGVSAYVSGSGDDESDYQETFGTHTINGITDITQIRWRGGYNCSGTQFGQSGSINITITGGSADIGLVLILNASDSFYDGCNQAPYIS